MRSRIKEIVSNAVYESTLQLLIDTIPIDGNVYYFVDDIFQSALQRLAQHFLTEGKLRSSEKLTLQTLVADHNDGKTLDSIKLCLIQNLNKIKPKWGELFGTNRGNVFHAFRYLLQWPCFSDTFRSQMKTEEIEALKERIRLQHLQIIEKDSQIEKSGQSLKLNEEIARKAAQRAATQFIEIQKLTMENKSLALRLRETEQRLSVTMLPHHTEHPVF